MVAGMKGILKTIKRYSITLILTGLVCLWFFMSSINKQYSNPNDHLVLQSTPPSKPLPLYSTSENTSFTTSDNKDPLRVRLGKRDEIRELFRNVLKNLESADKNRSEKTAPKRDDSRTYLNGVDTTRGGKLAKYGGLVRPQNNSRVDRKLTLYVSHKQEANVSVRNMSNGMSNDLLKGAVQDARESIQHLVQHKSLTSSNLVLLVTYMRSGSSWLGDITKQAEGSFYVYEPFQFVIEQGYYTNGSVCFYNDICREPRKDVESHYIFLKNLLQIYACDFVNLHPRVKHNVYRRKGNICRQMFASLKLRSKHGGAANKTLSKKNHSESECIQILEHACTKSKYRIIKTIRMSMELVLTLLDFIPHLKVIHLVRDPRAITNSRTHSGNMRMSRETELHSKSLCKEMHSDLNFTQILVAKYPTQITILVYEALAENPMDAATYIYKYLNMNFDDKIKEWIYNSTHSEENNGFYGTQRSNSMIASTHWRNETKIAKVKLVQSYCKEVMDLLGYVPFKRQKALRNLQISARIKTTIPGYS